MKKVMEGLGKEKGAATVIEMTLVFPFVLLVLTFLIYMGSYIMQGVMIYNYAQQIAVAASREVAFPGYEMFYESTGITTQTDIGWAEGLFPNRTAINKIMSEHAPYRYWNLNVLKNSRKVSLENSLKQLITSASFLSPTSIDVTITSSSNIISQRINVRVVQRIKIPPLLRLLGLDDYTNIDVTSVAVVGDSTEFIRNTDIVFDLKEYMFDNLKFSDGKTLNENIAIYKQKITDLLAKLGLG